MACRISSLLLFLALATSGAAFASGLDDKGEVEAKEATRLFNLGKYEEAAPIYAKLAVDYPDMVVFLRNLGACNYYLGKPEPALSSLRRYLKLRDDIKLEDRATVERWIDEMEKLRAARLSPQGPAPSEATPVAGVPALASSPATAPTPVASVHPGLQVIPKTSADAVPGRPFYKTWWFFTAAGAAVVTAVTTAIILSRGGSSGACAGRGPDCLVVE